MVSPAAAFNARFPYAFQVTDYFAGFGWPLALIGQFLIVFTLVALSGPGRIDIVDGQTRYEVARSLVDHGDSIIRDRATWFAVYKGREGEKYSDYRLPQSLLGVMAIWAADATGPVSESRRQFFFTLISPFMAAVLAVVYALWFRKLGSGLAASVAWGVAGVCCTPSWYYGTSTFDDILGTTAIVMGLAAAWSMRERRRLLGASVAALVMAWAVNCKPPLALFTLPVLAALCPVQMPWRRHLLPAGLVGLGVVLGIAIYKGYHAYKFPPGAEDPFTEYGKLYGDWTTSNPLPGLFGLAFSASCGVLWYCPTLFLSWRGWGVWRRDEGQRLFCRAALAASLLFVLSVSFLPFFKGEPCWGPRYLTPVFAVWWVFVPAALANVRVGVAKMVLGAGVAVQLLGLSVDPMRLFVQLPLHWSYYNSHPWLGFDGTISHLMQRPREITEILTCRDERAPEYNPAVLPTHAGCISAAPNGLTSIIGILGMPQSAGPLNAATGFWPSCAVQLPVTTQQSLKRYYIFNSFRPWIHSHWYLSEDARPVDLRGTILMLVGCGFSGLMFFWLGLRSQRLPSTVADVPSADNTSSFHSPRSASVGMSQLPAVQFAHSQIVT